ncbi:MAG: hypothetical protein ACKPKO_09370, partial [Candidatus Fonsibacter sp.]
MSVAKGYLVEGEGLLTMDTNSRFRKGGICAILLSEGNCAQLGAKRQMGLPSVFGYQGLSGGRLVPLVGGECWLY